LGIRNDASTCTGDFDFHVVPGIDKDKRGISLVPVSAPERMVVHDVVTIPKEVFHLLRTEKVVSTPDFRRRATFTPRIQSTFEWPHISLESSDGYYWTSPNVYLLKNDGSSTFLRDSTWKVEIIEDVKFAPYWELIFSLVATVVETTRKVSTMVGLTGESGHSQTFHSEAGEYLKG
jgi:hypothetical protein